MKSFGLRTAFVGLLSLIILVAVLTPAQAFGVLTGEYKLAAKIDTTVRSELATELWGQVWRPDASGPFPLVILLHGNHSTCGKFDATLGARLDDNSQYTRSGTCPAGYIPAPSHLGYAYLAADLAQRGYVVVSINANRGINAADGISGDFGLNLVRGRLVLRTMQELARWNAGTATPPPSLGFGMLGLMDFSHVGLMGHSRGGEGMRAAVAQYRDAGSPWPQRIGPVTFEAIFEIGPVDGQTDRILNAPDVAWNVILPGCDGDVSDLEGVRPYDRMLLKGAETRHFNKSSLEVFGANHNFYNSEWQFSETSDCQGQRKLFPDHPGSEAQQKTAAVPFRHFMLAHVGAEKIRDQARIFDPSFQLPLNLTAITQYARNYRASLMAGSSFTIDDFSNATGTSSNGVANAASGLNLYRHGDAGFSHDLVQRAASVKWKGSGGFLQLNAVLPNAPLDVSAFSTLGFRIALKCFGKLCANPTDPTGDVDFSVALAMADGAFSAAVALKDYAVVRRPVGTLVFDVFENKTVLQTVRIPLGDFADADLSRMVGVRFTFDKTTGSTIYLANVSFEAAEAGPGGLPPPRAATPDVAVVKPPPADVNVIAALRTTRLTEGQRVGEAAVEIELKSSRAFPVTDSLPVLTLGKARFRLSRFADDAQHGLIFTLTAQEFEGVVDGADAGIRIGSAPAWRFGALRKF